ncbi:MAG TPA: hypothetical protein VH592_11435 [Gemmataceae bacterium]
MKKLLTLLIIGGLLGLTTGCPQATTSQSTKGSTTKMEERKTGDTSKGTKMEDKGPKMEDKGTKMEDKKSPKIEDKGTKKEETKTEDKKK